MAHDALSYAEELYYDAGLCPCGQTRVDEESYDETVHAAAETEGFATESGGRSQAGADVVSANQGSHWENAAHHQRRHKLTLVATRPDAVVPTGGAPCLATG